MDKLLVLVAGLPGSGKSTLARQLAPALRVPLFDKDTILESLFDAPGGIGKSRRELSRESDRLLQAQVEKEAAGVLVSFWRLIPLAERLVNVHCVCPPEIAAQRFFERRRHPGHLDQARS